MDQAQRRSARLEKWKAAQAAAQSASAVGRSDPGKDTHPTAAKPEINKKLARLERWKSNEAQKPRSPFEERPANKLPVVQKRSRLALGDGPEFSMAPQAAGSKRPKPSTKESSGDSDPLDSFLSGLNNEERIVDSTFVGSDDDDAPGTTVSVATGRVSEGKNTKQIPQVDHTKMGYKPFRKQFYSQPSDLGLEPVEQVLLRQAKGITVKNGSYSPIEEWSQAGLPLIFMELLAEKKFGKLTPIQSQTLPVIMSGRDLIGVAQTGSGKTMAFLLPLLRHVSHQSHGAGEGPIAIVLAPTRELAVQIYAELEPFLPVLNISATCAYGGSQIKTQIAEIKRGTQIIISTPGRMIDLLTVNGGRVLSLSRVTFLVIDEADRMFDMGFEPQLRRIVQNIRPDRQTVLFSATLSPVMERAARQILTDPVHVSIGTKSRVAAGVTQHVECLAPQARSLRLLEILGQFYKTHEHSQAIIFVETQAFADELASTLLKSGYKCTSLHGGNPQEDRDSAIQDFKEGKLPLLVATSVAARGLDVKNLKLVVNFDPPSHLEDYVHRVGRTGRAGETGEAFTFLLPEQNRQAHDVLRALRLSEQPVSEELQKMSEMFLISRKETGHRAAPGFGGKGLSHLEKERKSKKNIERAIYLTAEANDSGDEKAEESPKKGAEQSRPDVKVSGTSNGTHEATLEINDYPQQARIAVTSFGQQTKVIDEFSVSITNRGQFQPPGGPNVAEKLHLLIEGNSKEAVVGAYEALTKLLESGVGATKSHRYNV